MAELKPCPFCPHGGVPLIERQYVGQNKAEYRVRCLKCGVRFSWCNRKKTAIEAWNRRAENET